MLRLAHLDGLTGLPNRSLLEDRLSRALQRAKRAKTQVAVMFLDLDGFKQVNDRLGHTAGDRILQEAARRIQAEVRSIDTAARLGGDEFVLVLEQVKEPANVQAVANRLILSLAAPFADVPPEIALSVSVGVSMYPRDAQAPDELLSLADRAMYCAKRAGKNRFTLHGQPTTE